MSEFRQRVQRLKILSVGPKNNVFKVLGTVTVRVLRTTNDGPASKMTLLGPVVFLS